MFRHGSQAPNTGNGLRSARLLLRHHRDGGASGVAWSCPRCRVDPVPIGSAVEAAWLAIPTFRPWVRLGTFTLMPDHIHGVLSWIAVPPGSPRVTLHRRERDEVRCHAARTRRRTAPPEEPLWQRSFDVRFILSRTGSIRVHRYILSNPRKAWVKLRR